MIRKFFASLSILVFVFVLPPLLIAESLISSFFYEDVVINEVVPRSYDSAIGIMAEKFANGQEDEKILRDRISIVITPEIYAEGAGILVNDIFEHIDSKRIDLGKFRDYLKSALPVRVKLLPLCGKDEQKADFIRFCRPENLPEGSNFESSITSVIEKQLPPTITFGDEQNPQISGYISSIFLVRDFFPWIICLVSFVFLLIVGILIFSPWISILKWISSAGIALGIVMALFVFSMKTLLENSRLIPILEAMTPSQTDLIYAISTSPLSRLTLWTIFIIIFSISLFVIGLFLRSKKTLKK